MLLPAEPQTLIVFSILPPIVSLNTSLAVPFFADIGVEQGVSNTMCCGLLKQIFKGEIMMWCEVVVS